MKKIQVYVVPLQNRVLFPYQIIKMRVQDMQHYDQKQYNNYVCFVTQLDSELEGVKKVQKYSQYGILFKITGEELTAYSVSKTYIGITISRVRVESFIKTSPFCLATVEILTDDIAKQEQLYQSQLVTNLRKEAKIHLEIFSNVDTKTIQSIEQEKSINKLIYNIATNAELSIVQKLKLLQIDDHQEKIKVLIQYLQARNEEFSVTRGLEERVKSEMSDQYKSQSQPRQFRSPLRQDDASRLEERMRNLNLPDHVKQVIEDEIRKLRQMGSQSIDSSVSYNYVDLILNLPWSELAQESLSIEKAKQQLDQDHFGLEKVKERILQFLAVRNLSNSQSGQILCFFGPPGVGKTSLGQSIATSLNRPFQRIALGGVSDEGQIRGHRRTYVGALPGMIINAMKRAKVKNPVILLDEIDKLTTNNRGDPSSALLEVLDPEQNSKFRDNYLDLEYDLSQVLFIATANVLDTIQPALRDRLDLMEITGYTLKDKIAIAKQYLITKQLQKTGLKSLDIEFPQDSLSILVNQYTAEAGVRQLERNISTLFRNIALRHVQTQEVKFVINEDVIQKCLGPSTYDPKLPPINQPGVARGLAWTPYGGKVLMIEVVKMNGKGRIEVTGMLGDVMKESVRTALGLIRAYWGQIKAINVSQDEIQFDQMDIHIHFPAGATPKDGPSAGIAITTAIISLLTGIKVRSTVAMTGEITLTGRVLPVGGIKEKVLGAYEKGIKNIIIPYQNKANLIDIEQEVIDDCNISTCKTIEEVLSLALDYEGPKIENINKQPKL